MIGSFMPAQRYVDDVGEAPLAPPGTAIVQAEHDITLLGKVLFKWIAPGAPNGLRGRSAVNVHQHRVTFGRIEIRGLDERVMHRLSVFRGQGSELGGEMRGAIGRIGMRTGHGV